MRQNRQVMQGHTLNRLAKDSQIHFFTSLE